MPEPAAPLREDPAEAAEREDANSAAPAATSHYDIVYPELSRSRRLQIPVIAAAVYSIARTIGPTLDYEIIGWHHAQNVYNRGHRAIYAFWHRCIFSTMWWWRHRGIVVMNTTNFDGQWTRKVIERLGYGTAQGSSSRGGLKGLAVMAQRLREGLDVAFTIDGPRGPRYVAKPGPAMLARKTGQPIVVFHTTAQNGVTLEKTWDQFQLPKPFSKVVMILAPPIWVPRDAGKELLEEKHNEMQRSLERVRDLAEGWFQLPPVERDRLRSQLNS